jgi:hypothetical protein
VMLSQHLQNDQQSFKLGFIIYYLLFHEYLK